MLDTDLTIIGRALSRIPSGCAILTAAHDGLRTGMLVSWVQQASFEPPTITVCVRPDRPVMPLIQASGRFVLNIIGDQPTAMFKQFGKGFAPDEDAFVGVKMSECDYGPVLADCVSHLGCSLADTMNAGDHLILLAQVKAANAKPDALPYVHIRKTGLSY